MKVLKTAKILCLFLFLLNSACTYRVKTSYEYSLENVDNPEKREFIKTKSFIVDSEDEKETPFLFEDDFIKIKWTPTIREFNFNLQNKTNNTIKVLWDSGSFITPDGANYRIINKSKKLSDEEGATIPTPIMKKAFIEDMIYPVGFVSYRRSMSIQGYYFPGMWIIPPLLPTFLNEDSDEEQIKREKELENKFKNKNIKILIPIEINNKIREYIFDFKIENLYFKEL